MRKFYINDKELYVTEVSGLGLNYDDNLSANFDDITLKVHFGFSDSAYKEYASLSNHLFALKGTKFALQYTFEDKTLKCLCELKTLTKSQKDHFNIMNESLILKRLSYWYEEVVLPITGKLVGEEEVFTTDRYEYTSDEPLPVIVKWYTPTSIDEGSKIFNKIYISEESNYTENIQEIEVAKNIYGPTEGSLIIDAETRQVYFDDYYAGKSPQYEALARDKDGFLYIKKGWNEFSIKQSSGVLVGTASIHIKKVVF